MNQKQKEKLIEYEKRVCKCGHALGPDHKKNYKYKIAEIFGDTYGGCNKCDCPVFVNREFPLSRHKRNTIFGVLAGGFLFGMILFLIFAMVTLEHLVDSVHKAPNDLDVAKFSTREVSAIFQFGLIIISAFFIRFMINPIRIYFANKSRITRPIQTGLETFCTCSICKKLMGTIRIESGLFVAVCEECNKKTKDDTTC